MFRVSFIEVVPGIQELGICATGDTQRRMSQVPIAHYKRCWPTRGQPLPVSLPSVQAGMPPDLLGLTVISGLGMGRNPEQQCVLMVQFCNTHSILYP